MALGGGANPAVGAATSALQQGAQAGLGAAGVGQPSQEAQALLGDQSALQQITVPQPGQATSQPPANPFDPVAASEDPQRRFNRTPNPAAGPGVANPTADSILDAMFAGQSAGGIQPLPSNLGARGPGVGDSTATFADTGQVAGLAPQSPAAPNTPQPAASPNPATFLAPSDPSSPVNPQRLLRENLQWPGGDPLTGGFFGLLGGAR